MCLILTVISCKVWCSDATAVSLHSSVLSRSVSSGFSSFLQPSKPCSGVLFVCLFWIHEELGAREKDWMTFIRNLCTDRGVVILRGGVTFEISVSDLFQLKSGVWFDVSLFIIIIELLYRALIILDLKTELTCRENSLLSNFPLTFSLFYLICFYFWILFVSDTLLAEEDSK